MFQIKWFWSNMRGHRWQFVTGLVLSIVTTLMVLVSPKMAQMIVDRVLTPAGKTGMLSDGQRRLCITLIAIMVAVTLTRLLLRYLMMMLFEFSTQSATNRIRERLYRNMLGEDSRYFSALSAGDILTRFTGDLDFVRHFGAFICYATLDSVVMFVSVLAYFFTINIPMTLCLLAIMPVIYIVANRYSKVIRQMYVNAREKLSDLNTSGTENIDGNRVVRAFAREQYEEEKFDRANIGYRDAMIKTSLTWLKYYPWLETAAQSLTVITVLVGGLFVMYGKITLGELMAFSSLTWALATPMRMIGILLNDINKFFASANKVIESYYNVSNIVSPTVPEKCGRAEGNIEFCDVHFAYKNAAPLFNGLSFHIHKGETLVIMGKAGSGKTTVVNLLLRFFDVNSGCIKVDGTDIRKWQLYDLRTSIGVATQDVLLFSDTIDGNIAFSDVDMPSERVKKYAEAADAEEFIKNMPDGYDTIIGERGVGLSGGQKQRIALARAMAAKPSILVLDDTTSAVDSETEQKLRQSFASLDFDCTKIIVASRVSIARVADKIIVLDEGRIAESGTHDELIKNHGFYYETCLLQGAIEEEV